MYMPRAPYIVHVHREVNYFAMGFLQNVLANNNRNRCLSQLLTLAAVEGVAVSWDGSGLRVLIGPSRSANVLSSTHVQSERHNLLVLF